MLNILLAYDNIHIMKFHRNPMKKHRNPILHFIYELEHILSMNKITTHLLAECNQVLNRSSDHKIVRGLNPKTNSEKKNGEI